VLIVHTDEEAPRRHTADEAREAADGALAVPADALTVAG